MLAEASPVGCENYNATVFRCWNQNPTYEPVTYFTKDASQMANNNVSRFGWLTYEMGAFYFNAANQLKRFPFIMNKSNATYSSDNTTYWEVRWDGYLKRGSRQFYFNYTATQSIYDEYVNLSLRATTVGLSDFPYNISFYRIMKNIDIWEDNNSEELELNNGTHLTHRLNTSTRTRWYNISPWLTIYSRNPFTGAVRWRMGENSTWQAIHEPTGSLNGIVGFYKTKAPPFPDNRDYTIKNYWIDVNPCVISCEPATSFSVQHLSDHVGISSFEQNYVVEELCRAVVSSFGGGTCTANPFCFMRLVANTDDIGRPLQKLFETIKVADFNQSWNTNDGFGWKNISGVLSGSSTVLYPNTTSMKFSGATKRCYVSTNTSKGMKRSQVNAYSPILRKEVNQTLGINVTLYNPPDETEYNSQQWAIFNCNGSEIFNTTEYYWLNNVSLYINDTLNYTETSTATNRETWTINLSQNLTLENGVYNWYCCGCIYDNCSCNWEGNYSVQMNFIEEVIQIIKDTDDDIAVIATFAALIGGFVVYARRRKKK
jgi:hypothetical protein